MFSSSQTRQQEVRQIGQKRSLMHQLLMQQTKRLQILPTNHDGIQTDSYFLKYQQLRLNSLKDDNAAAIFATT